jgi:hypothetical protein
MRKIKETEAHKARTAIIEGNFPEGMKARCAWCGNVREVTDGEFLDSSLLAAGPGKVFRCSDCHDKESAA